MAQFEVEHADLPGISTRQLILPHESPYAGEELGSTRMRTRTGVSVVAVVRAGVTHPSPGPDFLLEGGAWSSWWARARACAMRRNCWPCDGRRRAGAARPAARGRESDMHGTTLALVELGAILFLLGVLGRLAARIGMSPVPLYLLGGLLIGVGGLLFSGADPSGTLRSPVAAIGDFSSLAAETGVVLLLLTLGLALLVAGVAGALQVSATKVATGYLAARAAGIGVAGRWRAGATLTIRGEFSIVIAGLATASGTLPAEVPAFATAHVLILAVAGPLLTRSADGFGRRRAAAARVREARRARQAPLV